MASKGEGFHKNLKSKEVKILCCLGEGRRFSIKKGLLEEMLVKGDDFRKKRVFGVKIGKSIIGKRINEVLPVFRKIFKIKRESYPKDFDRE